MYHQEFRSPAELKSSVKCFWYNKEEFGDQLSVFEVVPDSYAEIIFYFGSLYHPSYGKGLQPMPSPFIMGLLDQPVRFYAQHRLEVIGIRCYPWAVFDLMGLPSGKGIINMLAHPVARLQPALSECIVTDRKEDAIARTIQYFSALYSQHETTGSMLTKAGMAIQENNGTLPVSGVAAAAHATVRTLERKFRQSSGHTVKDVSNLTRFEQVRNHLWLHPKANLAALATELGYTDQAHLSREFKRYSHTTPAAFARKAKTEKQAFGSDFVAFVQAG